MENNLDAIVDRIKEQRKKKGFSHENMAEELKISQVAYSKIEKNETKLTVDRLFQIANILETHVYELLDESPDTIYNQQYFYDAAVGHQDIQNLYQEDKEKTKKIEQLYEDQIKDLKTQVEYWKSKAPQ